jgi:peroxiredoxin Q/BCP
MGENKIIVGNKAPDFKASFLVDGVEKKMSLKDFSGKKIVLYFYPKDLTPGCTWQAENIRNNYSDLQAAGIVIVGVSKDTIKLHQRFVEKKELPFALVCLMKI